MSASDGTSVPSTADGVVADLAQLSGSSGRATQGPGVNSEVKGRAGAAIVVSAVEALIGALFVPR